MPCTLLQACVRRPLIACSSLLGRAAVLYLQRECALSAWLASLQRFLLGSRTRFPDPSHHEMEACGCAAA